MKLFIPMVAILMLSGYVSTVKRNEVKAIMDANEKITGYEQSEYITQPNVLFSPIEYQMLESN